MSYYSEYTDSAKYYKEEDWTYTSSNSEDVLFNQYLIYLSQMSLL